MGAHVQAFAERGAWVGDDLVTHSPHAIYQALPVSSVEILPTHEAGFFFSWRLNESFSAPAPFTFRVQHGPTCAGPWEDISDDLVDVYCWRDARRRVGKAATHAYRVVMHDGSGTAYASEAVMPYGDLRLGEFLLARDIIRRETLHARNMAGTRGRIWIVATYGTRCRSCLDPITGQVRNAHCPKCHGTGFATPYFGPFDVWFTFSNKQHGAEHDEFGGTKDDVGLTVRMIGSPRVKKNDVIEDSRSGRRFYVQSVANAAELRRIPIIQQLSVSEAAVSDACYRL